MIALVHVLATAIVFLLLGVNICGFSYQPSLESHVNANQLEFYATTLSGLEPILAKEIQQLKDVANIRVKKGGVEFSGSERTGFDALLWLRTPLKVMEKIADSGEAYPIRDRHDLYDFVGGIDWTCMINAEVDTIKCDCVLGEKNPTDLSHSHFSSLTMKNAIIDKFRDKFHVRPSVDVENPTLLVSAYIHKGRVSLYRVWSGEQSMHKRGYRKDTAIHRAAMRETTAAAILIASGWNSNDNQLLIDPMCGSGTIAIEAALMLSNTAPGLIRYHEQLPGPALWQDTDPQQWLDSCEEAKSKDQRGKISKDKKLQIYANDINPSAVRLAVQGATAAGVKPFISFTQQDIASLQIPPITPSTSTMKIITNPPWDIRLNEDSSGSWDKLNEYFDLTKEFIAEKGEEENRELKTSAHIVSGNPTLYNYIRYPHVRETKSQVARVPIHVRDYRL